MTILHINTSARHAGSASRELSARLVERFGDDKIIERDLADGIPQYTEATLQAVFTPHEHRTEEQVAELTVAGELIAELQSADAIVIGLPIYNFGPPATLKAWADLVAQAGVTFQYSEEGPKGLLADRPVYVVVASGGVPIGSGMDFSSTWLTQFLGFLGLRNVTVIPAGQLNIDPEYALEAARERIDGVELPALAA